MSTTHIIESLADERQKYAGLWCHRPQDGAKLMKHSEASGVLSRRLQTY